MFVIWQVSYHTEQSNGSSVYEQELGYPKYWFDMGINMQLECEQNLSRTSSKFWFWFSETLFLVDLESMSQLNIYTGRLRKLRRLALQQPL